MEFLADLWLAILVAAVFVFVASSVIHVALPIHKSDFQKTPGEESLLEAMRAQNLRPGEYMFPFPASMKDMGSPEMLEKYNRGPVGYLTVFPNGTPAIGKSLIQWFLYTLVVGLFVAYIASFSVEPEAGSLEVFRVTGSIATLGYAGNHVVNSIWKGVAWSTSVKFIFDGLVYALSTAAAFVWLWPSS